MSQKDSIFAELKEAIEPFRFDKAVAEVFDDMIKRSVPGYEVLVEQLAVLANQVVTEDSNVFDLGSSLGAVSFGIRRKLGAKGNYNSCHLYAIDNSRAMVEKSRLLLNAYPSDLPMTIEENDIQHVEIRNASLVILNFTLQFIPVEDRLKLLKNIYDGMNEGGVLVLSEKLTFEDTKVDKLVVGLHEDFKRQQGYSELEISQKREALQNVMIPESLTQHKVRLAEAGFEHVELWFQQYNFMSLVAIK